MIWAHWQFELSHLPIWNQAQGLRWPGMGLLGRDFDFPLPFEVPLWFLPSALPLLLPFSIGVAGIGGGGGLATDGSRLALLDFGVVDLFLEEEPLDFAGVATCPVQDFLTSSDSNFLRL